MSSVYRVLCLSHDPAIHTGVEFNDPEEAEEAILNGIEEHKNCDLMIGRYSYPLIELGCPATSGPLGRTFPSAQCSHSGMKWIDADWLRLLDEAARRGSSAIAKGHMFRCFTPLRVERLRAELGITPEAEL